jgi:hypothetical protein
MDEMENNEKMQEQAQTQQNTKEALRAAENLNTTFNKHCRQYR